MSFFDFTNKYKLKKEVPSNTKIYQVFSSLSLKDVRIHSRNGPFESDIEKVNLNPIEGNHWFKYINENVF